MNAPRITSKRSWLAAAAVVSLIGLSGCGSATDVSKSQSEHLTKVDFASAMSKSTSTARSVHMTIDVSAMGHSFTMNGDVSMNGASDSGTVADTLRQSAMSMTMDIPGTGTVEMRLVDGVMYMNAGALDTGGDSAKPWVKVDLTDPSNPFGSMLDQVGSMSPSQLTKMFRSISTLKNLGADSVDGVPATHYTVSVDTAKVAGLMGLSGASGLSSLPKSLTYNVWIDNLSRPIKMSATFSGVSMEMRFSKWNEPVHVVAPPASQVRTLN